MDTAKSTVNDKNHSSAQYNLCLVEVIADRITLEFDKKWALKSEDIVSIDEAILDTYISCAEKYWKPLTQLICILTKSDYNKVILGRKRRKQYKDERLSFVSVYRKIGNLNHAPDEWAHITCLIEIRSEDTKVENDNINFYVSPFDDEVTDKNKIEAAKKKLLETQSEIETIFSDLARLCLNEQDIKVRFGAPNWLQEGGCVDGGPGFELRGIICEV